MSTLKQINKSVEASVKAVANFEKKVAFYDARITSCIAKTSKKLGLNLTLENYEEVLTLGKEDPNCETYHWAKYDIINYVKSKKDNEKKLLKEQQKLSYYKAEQEKLQSAQDNKEKERAKLLAIFTEKLATAKEMWFARMEKWGNEHYDYIHEHFAEACKVVARYNELRKLNQKIYSKYGVNATLSQEERDAMWKPYGQEWFNLNMGMYEHNKNITTDSANYFNSKEKYVAEVMKSCKELWEEDLIRLADNCKYYGIDEDKVECTNVNPTEKGFEILITDGKPRVIHARIIWCAEWSVLVKPHSRYLITERKR